MTKDILLWKLKQARGHAEYEYDHLPANDMSDKEREYWRENRQTWRDIEAFCMALPDSVIKKYSPKSS